MRTATKRLKRETTRTRISFPGIETRNEIFFQNSLFRSCDQQIFGRELAPRASVVVLPLSPHGDGPGEARDGVFFARHFEPLQHRYAIDREFLFSRTACSARCDTRPASEAANTQGTRASALDHPDGAHAGDFLRQPGAVHDVHDEVD